MNPAVLLFDFDNTITRGDLLDAVIERFSRDRSWIEWEKAWREGALSAPECLRLQMGNLAASRAEILAFAANADIDPAFLEVCAAAARLDVPVVVVSDSFTDIILAVLSRHGLSGLPVYANEWRFDGSRIEASFPYRTASCPRCANCKAQHVLAFHERQTIFVGDGLSDVCAAGVADVVFAKDDLARHLAASGKPYLPFDSLQTIGDFLSGRRY